MVKESIKAVSPQWNVTVQAAAGTGKTWLLVRRILCLLISGVAADEILSITFTRKAAREIGIRVNESLYELALADDSSIHKLLTETGLPRDPDHVKKVRGLYEQILSCERPLRTTTFHAFCQELLQRFPFDTEVPTEFELLEQSYELESAAWRRLCAQAAHQQNGLLAENMDRLLDYCGSHNTRLLLLSFLNHRSDWWAYTENQQDPLGYATQRAMDHFDIDPQAQPIEDYLGTPEFVSTIGEYLQLLELQGHKTALRHHRCLLTSLDDTQPSHKRFDSVRQVLFKVDGQPRQLKLSAALRKRLGASAADKATALHERLCNTLSQILEQQRRVDNLHLNLAWFRCGTVLLDEFQSLKRTQAMLDFADLEWQAYRLLNRSGNANWIQYKLDQAIGHVLVDEFQDTNPTQWQLLRPLLEEILSGNPERERSIFLVGDAKQSIYGFRRADPGLMAEATQWLSQWPNTALVQQYHSWRSSKTIIDFVNILFGDGPNQQPLDDFSPHETHRDDLWGRVELLPLVIAAEDPATHNSTEFRNPLTHPRIVTEDQRYQREADLIADKIMGLRGLPAGAENKPLDFGDIIILLRDRGHAKAYEQGLRRAGIPYTGAGRGTLLESLEAQDITHLLRSLIAPFDDLALAGALRSPIFDCSDDDMMVLALKKDGAGYWRQRLATISAQHPRLYRAHCLLQRWQSLTDKIPVHDLLDRIYTESNIVDRYQAAAPEHLSQRVESNLTRLLELALDMDGGRYPSLRRFVNHLAGLQQNALAAPDEPPARDPNRVRIMTIHAAKGLEAAVVFLADSARPKPPEQAYRTLVDWPSGSPRPTSIHMVGRKDDLDQATEITVSKALQRQQREQANLLYVAVTRAQQVLIISGCAPKRGDGGWFNQMGRCLMDAPAEDLSLEIDINTDGEWVGAKMGDPLPQQQPLFQEPDPAQPTMDPRLTQRLITHDDYNNEINPSTDNTIPQQVDLTGMTDTSDSSATDRGELIHACLEGLSKTEDRKGLHQLLRQRWGTVSETLFQSCWEEASAVVNDPKLARLFDRRHFDQALNEVPILYQNLKSNRPVYGLIDRLIHFPEYILVLDYKTHAVVTAQTAAHHASTHAKQLGLYTQGVQRLWPDTPIKAAVLFTACRQFVQLEA
ncbi:MAG: UvrD-helicase domain-containing protein [Gammaproteobacteria bacterium]|nr:UvrD-helicase domain-containing protein [Gammaproteobacteria bacterium]